VHPPLTATPWPAHAGALLDAVGEPVRAYLRRRPDTIRAIVSLITDDGGGDDGDDGAGGGGAGGLLAELAGAGGLGGGAGGAAGGGRGGPGAWAAEGEGDEAAIRLLQGLEQGGGTGEEGSGGLGAALAALFMPRGRRERLALMAALNSMVWGQG
jgi:hypothetical protein